MPTRTKKSYLFSSETEENFPFLVQRKEIPVFFMIQKGKKYPVSLTLQST